MGPGGPVRMGHEATLGLARLANVDPGTHVGHEPTLDPRAVSSVRWRPYALGAPGAGAQKVGTAAARAARSWRSNAVGGERRLGAPKWKPWA